MLIPKLYLINSTNIEYLLWARHCLRTQDESMKKVDIKKEKKEEEERRRKKEQKPKLYFGVSNSDFRSKLSNTFEGFCARLDYFRLSGFAKERWDFTV